MPNPSTWEALIAKVVPSYIVSRVFRKKEKQSLKKDKGFISKTQPNTNFYLGEDRTSSH